MTTSTPAPTTWRSWLRFSLRGLFVLTVIAAVGFAWIRAKLETKRRERAAVKALQAAGADVWYDYQRIDTSSTTVYLPEPPGPPWLRSALDSLDRWLGNEASADNVRELGEHDYHAHHDHSSDGPSEDWFTEVVKVDLSRSLMKERLHHRR
ncbi:MAG: hypothetical protein N2C14_05090 [Planctomycetales bacterium]